MALNAPLNDELQALADDHRHWLSAFDARYLANWERLLAADNEAAMAEVSVRQRLQNYGVDVQPNEDLENGQQAPDFRCHRNGIEFCVEVTCIQIAAATKATGIPHDRPSIGGVGFLNEKVFHKCIQKARQASSVDLPVLVAIGTWHGFAAMQFNQRPLVNMLLTGRTRMTWEINIQTGQQGDCYVTTELGAAIFLKPDSTTNNPTSAREPISGALLCPMGMSTWEPFIIQNSNATRPFNPAAWPELEYGSVTIDQAQQQLCVNWQRGSAISGTAMHTGPTA